MNGIYSTGVSPNGVTVASQDIGADQGSSRLSVQLSVQVPLMAVRQVRARAPAPPLSCGGSQSPFAYQRDLWVSRCVELRSTVNNLEYIMSQFGAKANKRFSKSITLDVEDLPGSGWKFLAQRQWRTGARGRPQHEVTGRASRAVPSPRGSLLNKLWNRGGYGSRQFLWLPCRMLSN